MRRKTYLSSIEGMNLEIEADSQMDFDERKSSFLIRAIRYASGMNRKEFCNWLKIPYRTMQEWELGGRIMPKYVLELIAYKVHTEKLAGRI